MEPFPQLPVELVLLIIQTLLEIEPKRALDLVSLSREVQPIAERAIYRCIILQEDWQAESFCGTVQSRQRSQSFYQNRVEVLCMTAGLKLHEIQSIFSACSNIRMLGMFYCDDDDQKSMAELDASLDALAANGPRPSKLACDERWTSHPEGHHRLTLPLFQNVTHLELCSSESFRNFNTKHLHALTNLAYLSLLNGGSEPAVELLQNLSLTDSILTLGWS
ncbi:hypothetical protein C8J56DRAFT_144387 [Mycena floridula]|nr:hypothetical protein C8J56DRAFT_144387 [Mycena floridula]